jgi:hypothetical protein
MKRSLLIPALSLLVVVTACTADGDCEGSPNHNDMIENSADLDDAALCESIGGGLEFNGQTWLTSIDLPGLTSVGDNLEITGNAALTDISLSNLTSVGGSLILNSNDALTDISLSSLTSVDWSLDIFSHNALTNLDGLSSLRTVGGQVGIVGNSVLTDISGLSSLTSVGWLRAGWLDINRNPLLCQSLVDAFVAACTSCSVGNISNNLDGC